MTVIADGRVKMMRKCMDKQSVREEEKARDDERAKYLHTRRRSPVNNTIRWLLLLIFITHIAYYLLLHFIAMKHQARVAFLETQVVDEYTAAVNMLKSSISMDEYRPYRIVRESELLARDILVKRHLLDSVYTNGQYNSTTVP
jgi:hypothetical protein